MATSHIKGVRAKNYTDDLWETLENVGKVEIINDNVFKKKFGHVWVDSQKKLIELKCPNRNFINWKNRDWEGSKPFDTMEDFKYFHEMFSDEVLQPNSEMEIEEVDEIDKYIKK